NPDFLRNLQTLVERIPNHAETISAMRERMKKFAEMRAALVAKSQSATRARGLPSRAGSAGSSPACYALQRLRQTTRLRSKLWLKNEDYERRISEEQLPGSRLAS